MALVQVLLDDAGSILGTARLGPTSGVGAPVQTGLASRPGQCIVEVDIEDASALDAESLHAALRARGLCRSSTPQRTFSRRREPPF
jgi:hypothetical protein